jgi:uncharacterized protein (TIGR03086 family)
MTEISDRYRRRAAAFADKVAAVPPDGWDAQTPCDDWSARELVEHVVSTQGMFLGFVGQEVGDVPAVTDDPVGAWTTTSAVIQARLDDPEGAATEFDGLGGPTTFESAVDRFLSFDLVVHGWDLARATGQDETIEPDEVVQAFAAVRAIEAAFGERMRSAGSFGPEVETAADATEQEKLLAFVGREV